MWECVSQYVARTPPPEGRGGYYPDDHLVIWVGQREFVGEHYKEWAMQKYEDSCKGLCKLIKQHWRNAVYVESTHCGIWPDIDSKAH